MTRTDILNRIQTMPYGVVDIERRIPESERTKFVQTLIDLICTEDFWGEGFQIELNNNLTKFRKVEL
jgi:hypothetical protein